MLRDDFNDESDIDVLDHLRMERELGELVGRPVKIVSRRALDERATTAARKHIVETAVWLDVA